MKHNDRMYLHINLLKASKNPAFVYPLNVVCTVINTQYIHHLLGCTQWVGLSRSVDKIVPLHIVHHMISHAVNICLQPHITIWVRLFAKWHWNVYGSKGGEWEG